MFGGSGSRRVLLTLACAVLAIWLPSVAPIGVQAQTTGYVRVTNVTDAAFSISWVSASNEPGYVLYGASPSAVTSRAEDDRGAGAAGPAHHVTIGGLAAQSTYYVDVFTGASADNNGGAHYRVTTGPASSPGQPAAVYGQVARSTGAPPAGILVYLVVADGDGKGSPGAAAPMSGIVKPGDQGYWILNLGNARVADLSAPFAYSPSGDRLQLSLIGGPGETLEATLDTSAGAPASLLTLPSPALPATATPLPTVAATWTPEPAPSATKTPAGAPPTPTWAATPSIPPATPPASATPATAGASPSATPRPLTAIPSLSVVPQATLSATATSTPPSLAGTATPGVAPSQATASVTPEPTARPAIVTAVVAATSAPASPGNATPVATPTPPASQIDPLALVGLALVAIGVVGLGAVALLMRRPGG